MARLRRLNISLGWDHDTRVDLPLAHLGEPPLRAALWSALYAGAHAVLVAGTPAAAGFLVRRRPVSPLAWSPEAFLEVWR